jgi:hypothetical protein
MWGRSKHIPGVRLERYGMGYIQADGVGEFNVRNNDEIEWQRKMYK